MGGVSRRTADVRHEETTERLVHALPGAHGGRCSAASPGCSSWRARAVRGSAAEHRHPSSLIEKGTGGLRR